MRSGNDCEVKDVDLPCSEDAAVMKFCQLQFLQSNSLKLF